MIRLKSARSQSFSIDGASWPILARCEHEENNDWLITSILQNSAERRAESAIKVDRSSAFCIALAPVRGDRQTSFAALIRFLDLVTDFAQSAVRYTRTI